jgi:hypothetical protein
MLPVRERDPRPISERFNDWVWQQPVWLRVLCWTAVVALIVGWVWGFFSLFPRDVYETVEKKCAGALTGQSPWPGTVAVS